MAAISIVIPVFDDDAALVRLIAVIEAWARQPDEIVVVTSGSGPEIRGAVERPGLRVLDAPPNRGLQLDTGARAANGDVIWFLHADALPSARALEAIDEALGAGAEAGCFRFVFGGGRCWWKPVLETLIGWRVRAGGMVYGDQGIFATRAAYLASGGFLRAPLFEEVPLVRALRARGKFALLAEAIVVSPRRWERDGWWRRTLHNRWLAICHMAGVPADRLARRYGRRPPAETET